jgi:anti-sigma factor RsiW
MRRWFKRSSKTECDLMRGELSAYLDNELDPDERMRVESHIQSCQPCREEYESLMKTSKLLQRLPDVKLRRSFTISENQLAKKKSIDRLRVLPWVTAGITVILIAIFVGDLKGYFESKPSTTMPGTLPPGFKQYLWPVRATEFGLLGTLIATAIYTILYWFSRRRKK